MTDFPYWDANIQSMVVRKDGDLLHRGPELADVALAPLDLGRWAA